MDETIIMQHTAQLPSQTMTMTDTMTSEVRGSLLLSGPRFHFLAHYLQTLLDGQEKLEEFFEFNGIQMKLINQHTHALLLQFSLNNMQDATTFLDKLLLPVRKELIDFANNEDTFPKMKRSNSLTMRSDSSSDLELLSLVRGKASRSNTLFAF
jgi:hypothetical protein